MVIIPLTPTLSKARENHPAPLANEGGRLYWYRTREAAEEALIPVALPTQLADTSRVKPLAGGQRTGRRSCLKSS